MFGLQAAYLKEVDDISNKKTLVKSTKPILSIPKSNSNETNEIRAEINKVIMSSKSLLLILSI